MSLSSISINSGATPSSTGGSALTVVDNGGNGKTHKVTLGGTSNLDADSLEVTVTTPKVSVNAPNGYTQGRAKLYYRSPFTLDNGNTTTNTIAVTTSFDVELTLAEKREIVARMIQALLDTNVENAYHLQANG